MMKKIIIIFVVLLLTASTVFADDVSIDSSGNVKTGVSNANAELEVTGGSGEGGIRGTTSGTGGSGVYGINTTYGDYGILGYYGYGVFGYSSGGYAGYFNGNVRITANLTVDGIVTGYTETDPTVPASIKDGISWGEVLDIPNGFADNVDDGITVETDPTVNSLGKAMLSCSTNQVAKWSGSAWACADDNSSDGVYHGVAIVAKSGAQYSDPVDAMNDIASWCGTPSATNPCILKIMPGIYDINTNSLQMQEYVDIEGSGENVTRIKGNAGGFSTGVVIGSDNAEIRFLTVENYSGEVSPAIGILNESASPKITKVSIIVSSQGYIWTYSIFNKNNSSPIIADATINSTGNASSWGIYSEYNSSPTVTNTTINVTSSYSGEGIDNYSGSSPKMNNVAINISGGISKGVYSNDNCSPKLNNVSINLSGGTSDYGVYVIGSSMIQIDNSSIKTDGTAIYHYYYDSSSVFVSNTRIKGVVALDTGITCVNSFNDNYLPLNATCH